MKPIGVLISGRGSNLQALIDAQHAGTLGGRIAVVVSNVPEAAGLERAARAGIAHRAIPHPSRAEFAAAADAALRQSGVELVALAGFMRILDTGFIEAWRDRLVNIHPSLLPAFPGLHTHRRALEAGCKLAGATVHFVTAELDHGPIIAQAVVPVLADDTEAALAARVLEREHLIYPRSVRWLLEGALRIEHGVVRHSGGESQLWR